MQLQYLVAVALLLAEISLAAPTGKKKGVNAIKAAVRLQRGGQAAAAARPVTPPSPGKVVKAPAAAIRPASPSDKKAKGAAPHPVLVTGPPPAEHPGAVPVAPLTHGGPENAGFDKFAKTSAAAPSLLDKEKNPGFDNRNKDTAAQSKVLLGKPQLTVKTTDLKPLRKDQASTPKATSPEVSSIQKTNAAIVGGNLSPGEFVRPAAFQEGDALVPKVPTPPPKVPTPPVEGKGKGVLREGSPSIKRRMQFLLDEMD